MQQYFPYPFAFAFANNTAAVMTSAPICNVFWSASGNPPYNMSSIGVVIDPVAGTITTVSPTSLVFGGGAVTPPTDVQVFLPVANGALQVVSPALGYYTGTAALVDDSQRIKVVTVRDWTDYSLTTNMQVFANELLQSFCDTVLEGSTTYLGLATSFLVQGKAVQIAGNSYPTPWEGGGVSNPQIVSGGSGYSGTMTYTITGSGTGGVLSSIVTGGVITSVWVSTRGSGYTGAVTVSVSGSGGGSGASITLQSESLPVASVDVRFQPGSGGTSYVTTLHLSNRRARYTSELFVRPPIRGQMLGGEPFGAAYGAAWAGAAGALQDFGHAAIGAMTPDGGQLGTDTGAGLESHGFRGVTIDDTNREIQRQRRDERREQQQQRAIDRQADVEATAAIHASPADTTAADTAQAQSRQRAMSHPTEDVPE